MRIAFNTLHENPRAPSNAVRFIANMVTALADLEPGNEYLLYVGREGASMYDHVTAPSVHRRVFPHSNEARLRRMLGEQTALPRRLRADGVDVLHCVGGVLPMASRVPSLLSVITMHHKVVPGQIGLARTAFRTVMFDLSVRKATLVVANSESNRRDIERYLPAAAGKIVRIPDAADPLFCEPADPEVSAKVLAEVGITRPYILFASALYEYKGIDTLIDAFSMLVPELPHELVVAGHGEEPYVSAIKARAASLGVATATRFVGHQQAVALRSLYAEADVFVYPSRYETFGHPPLQAMGQRTPVVASDCSSIPEVVGDAAVLFDPASPVELAASIRRVIEDDDLRRRLTERGDRRARLFTWERTAAAVLDAYARCA